MPWAFIRQLLGPGLHWGMSQEHFLTCIRRAEEAGNFEAAAHLHIMLQRRNAVMFEQKETPGAETPGG